MIEDKQEFAGSVDRDARLVRFLAERVMEWELRYYNSVSTRKGYFDSNDNSYLFDGEGRWDPLINDHHAGQVMDRMAVKGFAFGSVQSEGKQWALFVSVKDTGRNDAEIVIQGNPPSEADFKAARLRCACEAAAKAHGWEG